jgi:hypothetical protein
MFSGEDSVRIKSNLGEEELEEIIENALDRLGRVRFGRRGDFTVSTRRFESSFATTELYGRLSKGRKSGEWRLSVNYTVNPSALCWVIAVLGFLFFVIGVLILLVPHNTKTEVERIVSNAIRDARDDVEEKGDRGSPSSDDEDKADDD